MSDNKVLIQSLLQTKVAGVSTAKAVSGNLTANVPQSGESVGKRTVPAPTATSSKTKEALSASTNSSAAEKLLSSSPESLDENSTLYDAFGPTALQFTAREFGPLFDPAGNPATLKSSLKDIFGAGAPRILAILAENLPGNPKDTAASEGSVNTPKVTKKSIVTKGTTAAVASIKGLNTKSSLEDIFGPTVAAQLLESVKSTAVEQLLKTNTIKVVEVAAKPAPKPAAIKSASTVKPPTPSTTAGIVKKSKGADVKAAFQGQGVVSVSSAPAEKPQPLPKKPAVAQSPKPVNSLSLSGPKTSVVPKDRGYLLPKNPEASSLEPRMWSTGEQCLAGYDKPWSLFTQEEKEAFDKEMKAEGWGKSDEEIWRERGIDHKDYAARKKWSDEFDPQPQWWLDMIEARKKAGLPTSSFVRPGYFESLRDTQINKFLLAVGSLYTCYAYPNTIYYVIAGTVIFYFLVFLYKLKKIFDSLKTEFRVDPRSQFSEAFQRDIYDRMKARQTRKAEKKKPPTTKK